MSTVDFFERVLHRNRQLRILFFDDKDQLKPEAAYYMSWLKAFCHADRSCYKQNPITGQIDPIATHVAEGRREVWLEHQKRLNLDTKKITRQLNQIQEEDLWQNQPPPLTPPH